MPSSHEPDLNSRWHTPKTVNSPSKAHCTCRSSSTSWRRCQESNESPRPALRRIANPSRPNMIEPRVIFTTGEYENAERAPNSTRENVKVVQAWIKHATDQGPHILPPVIPLLGDDAIMEDEYQQLKHALRAFDEPCPIGLALNEDCMMWVEDERGLPDTISRAKAILQCVDLTRIGRLPL